jgi:hypothetical protein
LKGSNLNGSNRGRRGERREERGGGKRNGKKKRKMKDVRILP